MCSEPLFISNFEFSNFLASRGPFYFFFLISICFEIAFFDNSDESNFDESKSLRHVLDSRIRKKKDPPP